MPLILGILGRDPRSQTDRSVCPTDGTPMEMTAYETGVPCWGRPLDHGPRDFTRFLRNGKAVAAGVDMMADTGTCGMTSTWTTYLAVDDLDAVAAKVVPAGDPAGGIFSVITMAGA